MSDSGLSTRLRQQSRRAGLMVGITMVLAIVILIFGAAGLFAWLSQPFSDLIPMVAPAADAPITEPAPNNGNDAVATVAPQVAIESEPPQPAAAEPTVPASADNFEPTHQIAPGDTINFRSGPSIDDPIIVALPPATPLQYLDEDAPTANPADGTRWMRFRNQGGEEGWVREIDTESFRP